MDPTSWLPRSLGVRTDLTLLVAQGSVVTPHPLGLVVRSPQNPDYHWGNMLIVDGERLGVDLCLQLPGLVSAFQAALPDGDHVAIAIDAPDLLPSELEGAELPNRVAVEHDVVLRATTLEPSGHPAPAVDLRPFALDDVPAWDAAIAMELTDAPAGPAHRAFVERRLDGLRSLQVNGHGAWWGAWTPDGELVAMLGVYDAGEGVGRYQNVVTRADHRRRGIAGALVRAAGAWALDTLTISSLVIVADPEGPAIGVYTGAGFERVHDQWALYRAPRETDKTSESDATGVAAAGTT